jgi:cytochrome c553
MDSRIAYPASAKEREMYLAADAAIARIRRPWSVGSQGIPPTAAERNSADGFEGHSQNATSVLAIHDQMGVCHQHSGVAPVEPRLAGQRSQYVGMELTGLRLGPANDTHMEIIDRRPLMRGPRRRFAATVARPRDSSFRLRGDGLLS